MLNKLPFFLSILLLPLLVVAQSKQVVFTLDPALTPDAQTIIFSYEGDLWKVPVNGGEATRLTAMEGEETRPNVSPDGKWLAFTGTQFGNKDVYIMPLEGGEIRQLTYHEAADEVDSWTWDSQHIYFSSSRYNQTSGYKVNLEGGTPLRLFNHYFNFVQNVVESPITGEIFFNESWESKIFAHRKRYKGDFNPDIKSYHPNSKEFKKYTDYRGKDFAATLDKQGNLYFISDEVNGEYNLYTFSGNTKKALTKFPTSIMWPKVSANGEKVVFRKDYQIYVYDVATGKTSSPTIRIFKNVVLGKEQDYKVAGNIRTFDVSSDKKKIAFVSRGRLFVSDIKGKFVKQLTTSAEEAVREVKWLNDNKTLLYSQTDGGYYNWFTIAADGSKPEKQITKETQNNRLISFNSDKTQGVYLSGRNEVRLLDLTSMKSTTLVKDELWGFYNTYPLFSPDDRYVVYNAKRHFENDIFVVKLEDKKVINLTHTKVSENTPFWSPDGKYLYFSSDRQNPSYPYGTRNSNIYKMALDKFEAPFKSDKFEELFKEEEKKEGEKAEEKNSKKQSAAEKEEGKNQVAVSINLDGLMERLEQIGPDFGQQDSPFVIQKSGKTMVFYLTNHDEGNTYLWKTTLEDFESPKSEKVGKSKIRGYELVSAGDKYYLLTGGNIHSFSPESGKLDKIEIQHTFRKRLSQEFGQLYYEAWAGVETNFYDEQFHGQDWQKLRDQYAAYLPHLSSREHLRMIFNDMLGELNTSHMGFYSSGKEEKLYFGSRSIATGVLFDENDPYVVKRIVKNSPADVTGKDIQPGDRLVAIDGVPVNPARNREMYLSHPSLDPEITFTFERNGVRKEVKLHTTTYYSIKSLLYDEWQDTNQAYVDEKSGNQVAYVHMKNMGQDELEKFMHDMVAEGGYKNGLILDLRFNTGGNVHDDVLRFLSQKPYLQWKYREGKMTQQSNFGPSAKPIVLLINEQSLSDAEMTAAGFKELGLGSIVGTETYRWIIFTSGQSLVDGSFYRLPSWGCYTLDGKDLEVEGVKPDIYVGESFKDRMDHRQPQLDKAIEVIMDKI
ncbi:S41 family peptidase [Rapidithrix thailandica]|uniref:Tricorn protease homolog n=1 Tax=Rapidithrix thailandica TaxID=413964 RepID=A0AAW9S0A2_9BACT